MRFKISQLLRYIGPDLVPKTLNNQIGSEVDNTNEELQSYNIEEGQFEILEQLHEKLKAAEQANIELKQKTIEGIREITKL